eukprot:GGOE01022493.1.p1 GENE.GGOE01022493.1~~GGOE01022493.1.p1  ORF type:complete len:747 (+),score=212.83 GGOE01022493.1:102-2342(+)
MRWCARACAWHYSGWPHLPQLLRLSSLVAMVVVLLLLLPLQPAKLVLDLQQPPTSASWQPVPCRLQHPVHLHSSYAARIPSWSSGRRPIFNPLQRWMRFRDPQTAPRHEQWQSWCAVLMQTPNLDRASMAQLLDASDVDLPTCQMIIVYAGKSEQQRVVEEVFAFVARSKLNPKESFYIDLMDFFHSKGLWLMILVTVRAMQDHGLSPPLTAYRWLLLVLQKSSECRRVMDSLRERDRVTLPRAVYGSIIQVCLRGGLLDEALSIYEEMLVFGPKPLLITFNMLISVCGKQRRLQRALKIWEEMEACDQKPDVVTYSSMIQACAVLGEWQQAMAIFRAMEVAEVQPDAFTYVNILTALRKGGAIDLAAAIHTELVAKGVNLTLEAHTSLLNVWQRIGECERAQGVFDGITSQGLRLDSEAYNSMLGAYQRSGDNPKNMEAQMERDSTLKPLSHKHRQRLMRNREVNWEGAEALFSQMVLRGVQPTLYTYNTMISIYEKTWQWEKALMVYMELQRDGLAPDLITYNSLISSLAKGMQYERALRIFEVMRLRNVTPDVITYSALLTACEKTERWEVALELFKEMLRQGIKPNVVAYTTLILIFARTDRWQSANWVFQDMKRAGVKPTVVTYSSLMCLLATQGHTEQVLVLYKEMQSNGVEPNQYTYQALMTAAYRANDLEGVVRLFGEMLKHGLAVTACNCRRVLVVLEEIGRWDLIVALAQRTQQEGLELDPASLQCIQKAQKMRGM